MLLILLASSVAGAEDSAKSLRREGYLASVSVDDGKQMVVVNCLKSDQHEVIRRVRIADPHAQPVDAAC
jgi:outer membrane lipoprotein SlyB